MLFRSVQLSLGITYNAILNNFGVTFEIIPNLVQQTRRIPGQITGLASGLGGGR